ncbi:hypothetical protein [Streptomyces sp. NPDC049585]
MPERRLGTLTAKEIADKALHELAAASSMHITMTTASAAEQEGMTVDLAVDVKGNCAGKVSSGSGAADVIKQGNDIWVRPDQSWLRTHVGADGMEKFTDLYLHGTTTSPWLKPIAASCDFHRLQDVGRGYAPFDVLTVKGEPIRIKDMEVVPITDRRARNAVYVAAEGKPYPVRIVHEGRDSYEMTFTDWDRPVPSATPPTAQTVDVNKVAEFAHWPSDGDEPDLLV